MNQISNQIIKKNNQQIDLIMKKMGETIQVYLSHLQSARVKTTQEVSCFYLL